MTIDKTGPVTDLIVNDDSKSATVKVGGTQFSVTDDSDTGYTAMLTVLAVAKGLGKQVRAVVEGNGNQIDRIEGPL
jgi:hypothetical protein